MDDAAWALGAVLSYAMLLMLIGCFVWVRARRHRG